MLRCFRIVTALVLGLAVASAWEDPHKKDVGDKNLALRTPEAIAAGGKLFASACAGCHGRKGEGGRGPRLNEGYKIQGAADDQLFGSIRNGVKGTSMPPFDLPEMQVRELLGFVRNLSAPASEAPAPGNAETGGILFYGKAGCGGCHSIRGRGGSLGPDLTNVGAERSLLRLRDTILTPRLLPSGEYRGARLTLKSGKTLEGVLRSATNYEYQLQSADGDLHRLAADDLKEVVYREGPVMPSFANRLSATEIDDILSFLARQTVRPRVSD